MAGNRRTGNADRDKDPAIEQTDRVTDATRAKTEAKIKAEAETDAEPQAGAETDAKAETEAEPIPAPLRAARFIMTP